MILAPIIIGAILGAILFWAMLTIAGSTDEQTDRMMREKPRVVCAWCQTEMRPGHPDVVSHGMCPKCFEKQKAEIEKLTKV